MKNQEMKSLELWQLSELCFETRCAELFENANNAELLKELKHQFERKNALHHYELAIAIAEKKYKREKND